MKLAPEVWLVKFILKYKKYSLLTIVGSIVYIAFFTLPAVFIASIIQFLTVKDYKDIYIYLVIYLGVAITQVTFSDIASYYNEVLAHRITTDMTYQLFNTLQKRSLTYLDKFDIGQIMASATNDTRQVNIGLSPGVKVIVQTFIQYVVICIILYAYEPRFIILFTIFFLGLILLNLLYGKWIFAIQDKILYDFENISVIANETFNGIQELKSYISEEQFINSFKNASQEHAKSLYKRGKIQAFYFPALWYWFFVAIIAILGFAWMSDPIHPLSLADFSGAFSAVLLFKYLLDNLNFAFTSTIAASAASRRLYKIIYEDIENKITDEPAKSLLPFDPNNMKIEFHNVSFRYETNQNLALKNINFTINPNETVVLIGPPGCGKSTINKLILRLYRPTGGEILLGGKSIYEYDDSYLNNLSSIEQNPFLFSETVEFNVKFGKPSATEKEVQNAIDMAQAQYVYSLPQKLETEIGDRGVKLSGGEKQRLAIARALLLDPRILLMDDASSALDAKTEMKIQESIASVLKERTAIITTHRLSVIAKADKIILLDQGEIIAQGTHRELITTSPAYRKLFEKQYNLPPLLTTI